MPIVNSSGLPKAVSSGRHLYHTDTSNCAARVRFLLEEKGLPWESHHLNLRRRENLTPEFFAINPKGLVPVLVDDGVTITESNDILLYLEEKYGSDGFLPHETLEREKVLEWLKLSGDIHLPGIKTHQYYKVNSVNLKKSDAEVVTYQTLQTDTELLTFHARHDTGGGFSKEEYEAANDLLHSAFKKMDSAIARHDWLAGPAYSLADISWAPTLTTLMRGGVGGAFPVHCYPNVAAWYLRISVRPAFESAILAYQPYGSLYSGR